MSPVDDIIINKQMPQKKKGKGIIVIFFLLLILLAGLVGAYYWYTTNMQETPKSAFFKYIVQTNIPEIVNPEIYYNMLERVNSESYETSTTADFTTTKETEFTKNVDVSKFEFTLDIKSNKDSEEALLDGNITYSSNDFFDLKLISTKDAVAIGSSEILDKYIASSKEKLSESLQRTTGAENEINADTPSEEIDKIADNRINLDEEYKTQKAKEYMNLILENVPEEAVSLTEASPITINSEVINTDAYTLSLEGQAYANFAKTLFEKLKNDESFLNKLVTGTETEVVNEEPQEPNPITTIKPVGGETEEHLTSQEIQTEDLNVMNAPDIGPLLSSKSEEKALEDEDSENIFIQIVSSILFNQKLDMSLEELQTKIDDEISKINATQSLKVTVYVKNVEGEEKQTIKIVAKLPDNADLDVEYPSEDEAKVTMLQDVTRKDEDGKEVTKNEGTSIEIKRGNSNTQTKFNIEINTIEEKKVVKKLQLDITTKGTKTSKSYSNDIIIKYNDHEGDYKINIENTLDFKVPDASQELNVENTIFIDQISDEEAANLYQNIMIKIMELYSEKVLNMNFIDNNSSSGVVEQPDIPEEQETLEQTDVPEITDTEEPRQITLDEARDLLVAKIEEMMADAEEHEEEFSILNLQLLPEELEGWPVQAEVTEEEATVTVAEYKFHIDKDFMLTEE